jgi:pimeloyl-ACP methyl ester carboxylesterase
VRPRRLAGSLLLVTLALATPVAARKIDVNGQRLYYELRGKGPALVVFDAGIGETHETWRWVWPDVARFARVFLYDRAGLGHSDALPGPRTSERMVEELHALLALAGLHGPYILVGHSFGGLNVQLFASRYPDQVTALVLVEPTPLDFPAREASLLPELDRVKLATALGASSEGVRLEHAGVPTSIGQLRAARPFPPHPVALISSTRAETTPAFQAAWNEMQGALAKELDVRLHLITSRAGHYVQFDAPELVIDAIHDAVERR